MSSVAVTAERSWWTRGRPFTRAELVADGIVHAVGLFVAIAAGAVLIAAAAFETAPEQVPALVVYWLSLLTLLGVSAAFNLTPISRTKRALARLDQAAIFLFIAGTYTPFLAAAASADPSAGTMLRMVWGAALVGAILKLTVPSRFGRWAMAFYLAIGWSGVLMLDTIATAMPPLSVSLLIAGAVAYSAGMVFHFWERLRFHNAVWHAFVVLGASLHLLAMLDGMVLSRL